MALAILVSLNLDAVRAKLANQQRLITTAAVQALTQIAKATQIEITNQLPKIFDRPTPFTMRAIGSQGANRSSLTSKVFVYPIQAAYLGLQIAGGTRLPRGRALVLPTDYPTDQYGNIPRGTLKRLLRRPDVFSGTVRGISGIWQRSGKGLILLFDYQGKAKYRKRFDFAGIGTAYINRVAARYLRSAIAAAR